MQMPAMMDFSHDSLVINPNTSLFSSHFFTLPIFVQLKMDCHPGRAAPHNLRRRDKTTLPELAWIISGCEFMVCNDSGPMHLAGAFHKKVIALMGPTKPEKTGPYWNACIVREPVSCSPCLKRECPKGEKGMECMKCITPGKVLKILEKEGLLK